MPVDEMSPDARLSRRAILRALVAAPIAAALTACGTEGLGGESTRKNNGTEENAGQSASAGVRVEVWRDPG
ncbi:MAG: hypothetical protein R8G01_17070 [Ilumatobacteraceae bacterium]|nr:hypothetical protein [Ilumatobacteraceae bacterium]